MIIVPRCDLNWRTTCTIGIVMKGNSFARFAKKAFKSRSRLHQHKFDHLKTESGFKCQFCKHIARGEKALATHVQRCHTEPKARKYECEICNKLLMSSTSLSAHKKTVHGYAFKFKCNWCNYSCKYKSSLDHHKLGHSEAKQEGFKKAISVRNQYSSKKTCESLKLKHYKIKGC